MRFTKMHGLGNDYIYVYDEVPENIADLSVRLSDRHFGIGSDGMIYITPSKTADFGMRIFNADGSEAMMCGNGIRCVGKYVYDYGYTDKTKLKIETLSGIKTLDLFTVGGKVNAVSVGMGKGRVLPDKVLDLSLRDGGSKRIVCTPVSVGNPHAVVFVDDIESVDLTGIGSLMEHHPEFPGGVNAEFVQVLPDRSIRMRVWERGSGVTMACGTGACASVFAAVSKLYCPHDVPVSVILDGGILEITVHRDGEITMTGPATTVFEGEITE